jgi:hypothetical protein
MLDYWKNYHFSNEKNNEILADRMERPEKEPPRVMDGYDGFIVIEERNDNKKRTKKSPSS